MATPPAASRTSLPYLRFLREGFRDLKAIGSVAPDSKRCVDSLLSRVPFDTAEVILEFGAATGTVTREIIRRKRPETRFFPFEKNPRLHAALLETLRGENVHPILGDVFDGPQLLREQYGIRANGVDCIVSTLPCSLLDFDGLMKRTVVPLLSGRGQFVQYGYVVSVFRGFRLGRLLGQYFDRTHSDLVLMNLPPALVYTCQAQHLLRPA
jgi:phospholipid N-methyltransferase